MPSLLAPSWSGSKQGWQTTRWLVGPEIWSLDSCEGSVIWRLHCPGLQYRPPLGCQFTWRITLSEVHLSALDVTWTIFVSGSPVQTHCIGSWTHQIEQCNLVLVFHTFHLFIIRAWKDSGRYLRLNSIFMVSQSSTGSSWRIRLSIFILDQYWLTVPVSLISANCTFLTSDISYNLK